MNRVIEIKTDGVLVAGRRRSRGEHVVVADREETRELREGEDFVELQVLPDGAVPRGPGDVTRR